MINTIFNTSPLIFLTKLYYLDEALALFDKCHIPMAVEQEICKKDTTALKLSELTKNKKIIIKQIQHIHLFEGLCERIGKGEAEAITLAIETEADYIILDDHAARMEAKRIGLNVKGTLGIIYRLISENKIIVDNEELFRKLCDINFRISRQIYNKIFE